MQKLARLFFSAFLALSLLTNTASAQTQLFLKLPGIDGESSDKGHKNWTDLLSYEQSLSSAPSTSGGMTVAGRTKFDEIILEKKLDKTSAKIMVAAASGQRFPEVVIEMGRFDGRDTRVFLTIRLTDVIISGHQFGIAEQGGSAGKEKLKLNFTGINWEYKPSPSSNESIKEGWDQKKNQRI